MRNITAQARIAVAAGAIIVAAMGFGAPGIAHPHGDEDGAKTRTERVIILSDRDGDHKAGEHKAGERVRHIHTMRLDGSGHLADCDGERVLSSESGGDNDRTKILICSKGELSAAQRLEKIEQVLTRIQSNERLSAEQKERVTAALREAIARMRTTP